MEAKKYIEWFQVKDRLGSLLGAKFISISKEECIYEYEPLEAHYNPNGILHGGALYAVMDSSQGAFLHFDMDPSYKFAATGTATIRYHLPVRTGKLRIRTWLKGIERRKIFISSTAHNSEGQEVATLEEIWIAVLK